MANHTNPTIVPEGERVLKVGLEAGKTAFGFIILPPHRVAAGRGGDQQQQVGDMVACSSSGRSYKLTSVQT